MSVSISVTQMLEKRTEYKRLIRKKALLMLKEDIRISTRIEKPEGANNPGKNEQTSKDCDVIKMQDVSKIPRESDGLPKCASHSSERDNSSLSK